MDDESSIAEEYEAAMNLIDAIQELIEMSDQIQKIEFEELDEATWNIIRNNQSVLKTVLTGLIVGSKMIPDVLENQEMRDRALELAPEFRAKMES